MQLRIFPLNFKASSKNIQKINQIVQYAKGLENAEQITQLNKNSSNSAKMAQTL